MTNHLSEIILDHVIVKPTKLEFASFDVTCAYCGYPNEKGKSHGYFYHKTNNKFSLAQINSFMSKHFKQKHPELGIDIIESIIMTKDGKLK